MVGTIIRVLIAVGAAMIIIRLGIGLLRGFVRPAPAPPPPGELRSVRIMFRCSICGTEVLLLRKGSEAPPRHCGEAMIMREEIARG